MKFRTPDEFLKAATTCVGDGECLDTHELAGKFVGPARTHKDLEIARELLALAQSCVELPKQERTDALHFACDLLSDNEIDDIANLLQDEDEYVRKHAAALRQLRNEHGAFVEECAGKLQQAGIQASVHAPYGKKAIKIDPGPIWLNMDMLFSKRNRPDFEDYLIARARYFLGARR